MLRLATRPPGRGYNCYNFAREAWHAVAGEDLGDRVPAAAREFQAAFAAGEATRAPLADPVDPCLVVFPARRASPHIGVYTRGKVWHYDAGQAMGERLADMLARMGEARFYA